MKDRRVLRVIPTWIAARFILLLYQKWTRALVPLNNNIPSKHLKWTNSCIQLGEWCKILDRDYARLCQKEWYFLLNSTTKRKGTRAERSRNKRNDEQEERGSNETVNEGREERESNDKVNDETNDEGNDKQIKLMTENYFQKAKLQLMAIELKKIKRY